MEYYAPVNSFKIDILSIYGYGKMAMVLEYERPIRKTIQIL